MDGQYADDPGDPFRLAFPRGLVFPSGQLFFPRAPSTLWSDLCGFSRLPSHSLGVKSCLSSWLADPLGGRVPLWRRFIGAVPSRAVVMKGELVGRHE